MTKKGVLQTLLIIVITLAFIFYIRKNFNQLKDAISIRPSFLAILALLNLVNKLCLGFKTNRIMKSFNIQLSFKEWFGMSCVSNFYNYLAPKSGTAVCGVYLKNKYGFDYHKYISALITTGLITILTSGLAGLAVSLFFYLPHFINTIIFIILFAGMAAGSLVIFLMPRIKFPKSGFFEKINEFFESWEILRKDFKTILVLAAADLLILLSVATRYFVIFKMFSLPVAFASCILLSPFNIITHFATIIPGGYGIKEATVGAVSTLTNVSFAAGALATLSDRVIMMAAAFILGPIFSFILLKHSFKAKKEGSPS